MQIFPCRNHIRQILFGSPGPDGTGGLLGKGLDRSPEAENTRFLILTAVIGAASFALAMALTDLGVILSVVGATGSTTISYILPGLFYFKVFEEQGWSPLRTYAAFLCGFGCFVIPTALTFIFL